MLIEIIPTDTLFFREFKPFTSGEDVFARSLSKPPLTTIRGALRAHYFRNNPKKFKKENLNVKGKDPTYDITIKGLYYKVIDKINDESILYIPKPIDLVKVQNENNGQTVFQRLIIEELDRNKVSLSIPQDTQDIPYILVPPSSKQLVRKQSNDVLMSIDAFQEYLRSSKNEFSVEEFLDFSEIVTEEPKIGIKISEKTRTTEEEMFYHVIFNRYETKTFKTSFVVEIENLPDDSTEIYKEGIIKLGGEGKLAKIREFPDDKKQIHSLRKLWTTHSNKVTISSKQSDDQNFFAVYLFTPTPLPYITPLLNPPFKLETYLTETPILISGYSLKKRSPKATTKALNYGTILLLSLNEDNASEHNNSLQKLFRLHEEGKSLLSLADNKRTIDKDLEMGPENGFGRIFLGLNKNPRYEKEVKK